MAPRKKSRKAPAAKGRPSLFDAARGVIIRSLRTGASIRLAIGLAGVSKTTFHTWMKQGESELESDFGKFADEVKRARSQGELRLVDIIRKAAERGEWKASCWLLERIFFEQYGRRIVQATEAPDGIVPTGIVWVGGNDQAPRQIGPIMMVSNRDDPNDPPSIIGLPPPFEVVRRKPPELTDGSPPAAE